MPNTTSAKKALRQNVKHSLRNIRVQEQIAYAVKSVRKAVASSNSTEAEKWLLVSQQAMDKAAQKQIIKKNNAARRKSRLARLVHTLSK